MDEPKKPTLRDLPDIDSPWPWPKTHEIPNQGTYTEDDYLRLTTNRLVEFADGTIEVLSMPTLLHQRIVAYLYNAIRAFITARKLGEVFFAPLPLHLWRGRWREPDLAFVRVENKRALEGKDLEGADLVVEVVSADDPDRDWKLKRREYAQAGITEYWVVDPFQRKITVFRLEGKVYSVHGEFEEGQRATSAMFPELSVAVSEALAGG